MIAVDPLRRRAAAVSVRSMPIIKRCMISGAKSALATAC
jgi:hypothetical protein